MKVLKVFLILAMCFMFVGCGAPAATPDRTVANTVGPGSLIELSIYTYDGNGHGIFLVPNLGHSFVSAKNVSAGSLTIGNYVLTPGEEITIGTFVQTAHSGVWYNIEAAYTTIGTYQNVVSLTIGVSDASKITAITDYIINSDYWSFTKNCTDFALDIWNIAAGEDAIEVSGLFTTPTALQAQLMRFNEFELNRLLSVASDPSYYDGTNLIICTYIS